jgi:TonB family protein
MGRTLRLAQIGLAVVLTGLALSPAPLRAQQEAKRKVKTQVEAIYPELARKYNLIGKVRLSVVVGKDGKVKSTKILGGNAVLANSALDAVKDWKFLPGPDETTEVIEFDFKGKT